CRHSCQASESRMGPSVPVAYSGWGYLDAIALALAEHALTDALSSGYNSVAQMFFSQEKELYMRREERNEPQYIAPIGTVPSIPSRGSLSHKLADQLPHESVALQEVQDRRTHQRVPGPGDRTLHDYANVSLSARNPLRYKRNDAHTEICVSKNQSYK